VEVIHPLSPAPTIGLVTSSSGRERYIRGAIGLDWSKLFNAETNKSLPPPAFFGCLLLSFVLVPHNQSHSSLTCTRTPSGVMLSLLLSQLEKIKSNVYRRRQKWVEMLDKHKDIVAKHESGEKVVEDQELDMSKKRIEQVERKIQRIDEMKEEDFLKEQRKAYGRWNERGIKDEL